MSTVGYRTKKFKDQKKQGIRVGPSLIKAESYPKYERESNRRKLYDLPPMPFPEHIAGAGVGEETGLEKKFRDKGARENKLMKAFPGLIRPSPVIEERADAQAIIRDKNQMGKGDKILFRDSYEDMLAQYVELVAKRDYVGAKNLCDAILSFIKLYTTLTPMRSSKRKTVTDMDFHVLLTALKGRPPRTKLPLGQG